MVRLIPRGYRRERNKNERQSYKTGGQFVVGGKLIPEAYQKYLELMERWEGFIPFLLGKYNKLMKRLYILEGEEVIECEINLGVFNALFYYNDGHNNTLDSFACTAVKHCMMNLLRRRLKFGDTVETEELEEVEGRESELEIAEEGTLLPKVLAVLKNQKHIDVVTLIHDQGMKIRRVAKELNVSHQAIRSRLKVVRKRLTTVKL